MKRDHAKIEAQLAKIHPRTTIQVNNYIRRHRGVEAELRRGNGYCYFASLFAQAETAVYVNSVSKLSYEQWLKEYDVMAVTD